MKKILISIFITVIILTPLLLISKIEKVEAINEPAITGLNYTKSKDSSGQKWDLNFTLKTNYVGNGANLIRSVLNKNKTGNEAVIDSVPSVLDTNVDVRANKISIPVDNTEYIMEWKITTGYCDNGNDTSKAILRVTTECKGTDGTCSTPVIENKIPKCVEASEYVDVNPKIGATENKSTYNFLAPIGSIKCMDSTGKDANCIGNNIGVYLNLIFKIGIGLCAALAVIMLIIYGVTYMGDESVFGKTEAKHKMIGAIVGLLIALGAWVLLNTINPDLTGSKGLNIKGVSIELERTSGGGFYGVTIGTPGNPNANKNITTYDSYLKKAADTYGIECTLLKSFMYAESGGVNGLTSPDGAQGLIQLMPATFKEQGVGNDPMDPETNTKAAASYLSRLKKNGCNGSTQSSTCDVSKLQYLAASYNGGPGANKDSNKCPNMTIWQCPQTICNDGTDCFKETRTYSSRVEANYNKLKEKGWGC